MLARLAEGSPIEEVLLVGNTAMHHLFSGLSVEPLAAVPFRSPTLGARHFDAQRAGLGRRPAAPGLLPALRRRLRGQRPAGRTGGDRPGREPSSPERFSTWGPTARSRSAIATGSAVPRRRRVRRSRGAASAWACVPAAGRSTGCRSRTAALECSVIGGGSRAGLCGSGLVDAAAAVLDLGWVEPSGRMTGGRKVDPAGRPGHLTQADIRELQLAKGAVAAGLDLLLDGRRLDSFASLPRRGVRQLRPRRERRRIGLLPAWVDHPTSAGNTALRGAQDAPPGRLAPRADPRADRLRLHRARRAGGEPEVPGRLRRLHEVPGGR